MKRHHFRILQSAFSVLALSAMLCIGPAAAGLIRIVGDKATPPNSSDEPDINAPPASTIRRDSTLKIVGDRPDNSVVPEEETAEQQLNRRLTDLKAEEERKLLDILEQERLARVEVEQKNEVARQAAIKQEQELLSARKAEEMRIAAEQAEQAERIRLANEKSIREKAAVEEDRLTAARKAVFDRLKSEIDPVTTSVNRFDPNANTKPVTGSDVSPCASIWDLYLSAKAIDPALGRTESRVSGSKADSDLIFSELMPHLNSSAGVRQTSQSLFDYAATDQRYNFTAFNYNVTAHLTLLNVPTIYALSATAAALGVERAGLAAARQNLIEKLTDSYFSLLKAQTDKQIALGEINRLKQVLEQSQAFLKAGKGDIISVYEAQSRLDSAGADLTKSESSLRLAEQKLSSQVGKPVTTVINYVPQQPAGPDPDDISWWVTTMENEQPLIRQAREAVVQMSEQRKAAKSEYLPVLQASGGYDVNRGTAALPTAEVRQWFFGATISLPLYSGGETSAKVRRAVASEEERRHTFDETMDQQRENVKQAFFNLRYNISLIKALDQRKASAEIQLAAVKKGRKIGTRNAIDVLNAEQTYSLALRDYRYALYDNIIRVIQLKSAAGILAEADISGLSAMEAPAPENGLNLIISQVAN